MAQLIETALVEDAQAPANGVLPNVVILGQRSRNKRFYTEEAMRGAVGLYEGKAVYISHAGEKVKHRPATERYGRLTNVRFDEASKKLRGDLTYLESQQQMTAMVKEDLDRKLNFFGLSHVADGQWHRNNEGVQVVTRIEKVDTVDLVSDPATVSSLREQADAPTNGAPAPHPADAALTEGFVAACTAILSDSTLDVPAKVAKIKELLEKQEAAMTPAEKKDDAEPAKEQTAAGVKALVEQLVAEALGKAKPKKYVTAPAPAASTLLEQTNPTSAPSDLPPVKDKAALRKWLAK